MVDCPLSKGNQAATPKIERPNGNKAICEHSPRL